MKIGGYSFPDTGGIDVDKICRFSAKDIIEKMGAGWIPSVELGQLILEKPIGIDASILIYTSVEYEGLARGKGTDSIRIVLKTTGAYQKKGHWTTRTFPDSIADYDEALRYIVMKIGLEIEQLMKATRPCPDCKGVQVKLTSKNTEANPGREFWKCGGSCGSTWKGWADGRKNGNKTRPCPDCGHEQTLRTSQSAKNPGRKYWKCDSCPSGRRWKEWAVPRKNTRLTVEPATTIKLEAKELERALGALKPMKTEDALDTGVWVQKWDFESSSSGKIYTIAEHKNGHYGCSCPAWTYQHNDPREPCKHIAEFLLSKPMDPDALVDALSDAADEEEQDWGWF